MTPEPTQQVNQEDLKKVKPQKLNKIKCKLTFSDAEMNAFNSCMKLYNMTLEANPELSNIPRRGFDEIVEYCAIKGVYRAFEELAELEEAKKQYLATQDTAKAEAFQSETQTTAEGSQAEDSRTEAVQQGSQVVQNSQS